ncbi:hypothetical protein D3C75_1182230 [compost metagenome]
MPSNCSSTEPSSPFEDGSSTRYAPDRTYTVPLLNSQVMVISLPSTSCLRGKSGVYSAVIFKYAGSSSSL